MAQTLGVVVLFIAGMACLPWVVLGSAASSIEVLLGSDHCIQNRLYRSGGTSAASCDAGGWALSTLAPYWS